MLEEAARTGDVRLEDMDNMQMTGDHSAQPELYQRYLDTIKSDPLSLQNALAAAADFLETNIPDVSAAAGRARLPVIPNPNRSFGTAGSAFSRRSKPRAGEPLRASVTHDGCLCLCSLSR